MTSLASSDEVDFNESIRFDSTDSEDQRGSQKDSSTKLVEVSKETKKLLTSMCTRRVKNAERLQTRSHYPLPKVPATRTPQLDSYLKSEISQGTKAGDKDLARIQTFVLDALDNEKSADLEGRVNASSMTVFHVRCLRVKSSFFPRAPRKSRTSCTFHVLEYLGSGGLS